MNGHGMEVKYWTPKLLKLTQIGNPEVANGEVTSCFVDPRLIAAVVRAAASFYRSDSQTREPYPRVECTTIWLSGGGPSHLSVTELPDQIALMRDRALEVPVDLGVVK